MIASTSKRNDGQRFWLRASRPSKSSMTVARVFGSRRAPLRNSTSALGSSGACAQTAARAVVLERAAHQPHAIGEQCRSERVAGIALVRTAIEGESPRLLAVDAGLLSQVRVVSRHRRHSPRLLACGHACRRRTEDRVRACVAFDDEPGVATSRVKPQLAMRPGRVVAQVHVLVDIAFACLSAGPAGAAPGRRAASRRRGRRTRRGCGDRSRGRGCACSVSAGWVGRRRRVRRSAVPVANRSSR